MAAKCNFLYLLPFLLLNCGKYSILHFKWAPDALEAGYKFHQLKVAYSENPCKVVYPDIYVDSTKGKATYWYLKTNLKDMTSDTHSLKNGFYFFRNEFGCFLDSEDSLEVYCDNKNWGRYFRSWLYWKDELGFLKKGQKEGQWTTYITCEDTVKGYYSKNLDKYEEDSTYGALAHGDFFFREPIYHPVRVEFYKEGWRHGKYICYDVYFRKIIYETLFKQGTGYYKDFYLCDGMPLKCEGQFLKGQKVGRWIYYTIRGTQNIIYYK